MELTGVPMKRVTKDDDDDDDGVEALLTSIQETRNALSSRRPSAPTIPQPPPQQRVLLEKSSHEDEDVSALSLAQQLISSAIFAERPSSANKSSRPSEPQSMQNSEPMSPAVEEGQPQRVGKQNPTQPQPQQKIQEQFPPPKSQEQYPAQKIQEPYIPQRTQEQHTAPKTQDQFPPQKTQEPNIPPPTVRPSTATAQPVEVKRELGEAPSQERPRSAAVDSFRSEERKQSKSVMGSREIPQPSDVARVPVQPPAAPPVDGSRVTATAPQRSEPIDNYRFDSGTRAVEGQLSVDVIRQLNEIVSQSRVAFVASSREVADRMAQVELRHGEKLREQWEKQESVWKSVEGKLAARDEELHQSVAAMKEMVAQVGSVYKEISDWRSGRDRESTRLDKEHARIAELYEHVKHFEATTKEEMSGRMAQLDEERRKIAMEKVAVDSNRKNIAEWKETEERHLAVKWDKVRVAQKEVEAQTERYKQKVSSEEEKLTQQRKLMESQKAELERLREQSDTERAQLQAMKDALAIEQKRVTADLARATEAAAQVRKKSEEVAAVYAKAIETREEVNRAYEHLQTISNENAAEEARLHEMSGWIERQRAVMYRQYGSTGARTHSPRRHPETDNPDDPTPRMQQQAQRQYIQSEPLVVESNIGMYRREVIQRLKREATEWAKYADEQERVASVFKVKSEEESPPASKRGEDTSATSQLPQPTSTRT